MKLSIPWLTKRQSKSGRVGVAVGPDGLAIIHLDQEGNLRYCQFHSQPGDQLRLLSALVDEQGWQGMSCSVVLHPVYYQLLLVESPPVQTEEMGSAVRWLIKELLDYPPEEAAIEYFSLPGDAYRGRQNMLYVAALRKKTLHSLVAPAHHSGLNVDCVEISELALHNITARLPPVTGAVALVQLYEGEGFINLIEDGAVYLCRRLDIGLERLKADQDNISSFELLLLEIQRSVDYYESQLGKGIVTTLYYSPGSAELAPLGKYLSDQLGLNITPLSLQSFSFADAVGNDDQPHSCTSAIGAALGPLPESEAVSAAS